MHPITGADHLAAMLAVGIWSALATRRLWLAPLSFAALLLVGALASQWGLVLPGVEPMIAASLLIMGLLIVGRTHLPEWSGAVLVGVFAMFHGAAHGQELDGHWALAGMVISTAVLHGLGMAIGAGLRRSSAWISTTAGMAVSGLGLLMTAKLMTA
jgi:urease accessory protein